MSFYKHGVYGNQVSFQGQLPLSATGTVPAYIGTAPIQQLNTTGDPDFDYTPYINKPILVSSYKGAASGLGYSNDWASFTLGEAVSAHFLEGDTPIGPIICVNMANPATVQEEETSTVVPVTGPEGNKVGYLRDPLAALEHISIDTLEPATDYTLAWEEDSIKVTVLKTPFQDPSVTLTYAQMDVSQTAITAAAFSQAVDALDFSELLTGQIPNLLVAPGWSHSKEYHDKMVLKATSRIGEKWYLTLCSDLPTDGSVSTVEQVKEWKESNGYDSKWDRVCWPMAKTADGRYHLSTVAAVTMQTQDFQRDGVPYVSPSNKLIFPDSACLADGTPVYLSEPVANSLNEVGITTVNIIRGSLRLWGPHNANYSFRTQDDISPEDRLDTGIRMPVYLMNYLQRNFIDRVDNPMSRRDKDDLLASAQQWLNYLVNSGMLLYGKIDFREDENSTTDMVSGDFTFSVQQTNTPNAKSLTFNVEYVTTGLSVLTGGAEA